MSAYVDGELWAKDGDALEAHVGACERCRLELEQLRATVSALQELPEVKPQRSFALTPDMLRPPRPVPQMGPSPALVQGMRLTAAGLAAALALVFVIDVSDSGTNDGDDASGGAYFFYSGPTTERNISADDGDGLSVQESASDGEAATTVPQQGYDSASVPTPAATEPAGGVGAGGSGGVGGAPDVGGGVDDVDGENSDSEPPSNGADAGDLPLTGEEVTSSGGEPAGETVVPDELAGDDAIGSGDEETGDKIVDLDAGQANGDAGSDGGAGQPASLASDGGGGFDTLLALEIVLGAALIATVAGAIWVGAAARQNSICG